MPEYEHTSDDHTKLAARAEAFLFVEGGSLSTQKLSQLLHAPYETLPAILDTLAKRLAGSGLTLIRTDTEATLAVAPDTSETIKEVFEGELGREIGTAGLEVLAVILYRGPSTRAEIDYIRGVNTSSTLRTLLVRGLIERTGASEGREYRYRPTAELLAHLGVTAGKELPEYAKIASELAAFEEREGPFDKDHTHGGIFSQGEI